MPVLRELALTTATAQVQTVAVTTFDAASTYRLVIGSPGFASVTVNTPGAVSADQTETNIATNVNASDAADFVTASASGPDVTITSNRPGIPITVTASVVGGTGAMTSTTTTASALAGDLDISEGRLHIAEGADAVAQRVRTRLLTIKGEWVFDTTIGTPWFSEILGGRARARLGLIQQILRDRILQTDGVRRINELNVSFAATRGLVVTGSITAVGGSEVPISLEFGG